MMSKQQLRDEIRMIREDRSISFSQTVGLLCDALRKNGDALTEYNASYSLRTSDTDFSCTFVLLNGSYSLLPSDAPADVSILSKEADFLALLRGELNPVKAVLFGRVKITGDKAALLKFGEFL